MAFVTSTATDYKDLLDQLLEIITQDYVTTAAVNAGGTGYVVGDILTVAGGTSTHTATLRVTSVAGGVIDGIQVEQHGAYTVDPTLTANAVTGGTGSSATIDLTMQVGEWTTLRDQVHASVEQEVIIQGDGSGSDEIYCGIRTFQDGGVSAYNWELAGFTGYDGGLTWDNQPGISPGRYDAADPANEGGQFVLLANASITFWIFHTGRYVIGVTKIGSTYSSFFLGFLDTYATTSESVYPLYIAGSCAQKDTLFNSSRGCHTNYIDPRSKDDGLTDSNSSAVFRYVDGNWYSIANAAEDTGVATTSLVARSSNIITPTGTHNVSTATQTADTYFLSNPNETSGKDPQYWSAYKSPVNASPTYQLRPTPDTPSAVTPFWPAMITMTSPATNFAGEVPISYWLTIAGSSITAEDEIVVGNDRYLVFSSANQTDDWNYFAVKKTA